MRRIALVLVLSLPTFGYLALGQNTTTDKVDSKFKVPPGFKAKQGTIADPYSKTDWAKEIVHEKTGMEMMFIPAGKFMMGSDFAVNPTCRDEVPQNKVTISHPFYMGKYEITVAQFRQFVEATGYKTDAEKKGRSHTLPAGEGFKPTEGTNWRNPGFDQGKDHPVLHVTWEDAQEFVKWASRQTGQAVRLPTEAEWEYACRAGTTTAYPWGEKMEEGQGWGNFGDLSMKRQFPRIASLFPTNWPINWDDGFAVTAPVGKFRPNQWGLYDCSEMYGNGVRTSTLHPGMSCQKARGLILRVPPSVLPT